MGVFITLHDPTSEMKREAALAGEYRSYDTKVFPRVQILSMREYFQGHNPDLPTTTVNPFKIAEVKPDQRHLFSVEAAS